MLAIFLNFIRGIISDVLIDILKTPAKEVTIEEVSTNIEHDTVDVDIDMYDRLLNRS